jgi:hypothetical protein
MQALEQRTGHAIGAYIHVRRDSTMQSFKSDQRELEAMATTNSSGAGGLAEGLQRLTQMLEPKPGVQCGSAQCAAQCAAHCVLHAHVCMHRLQGGGAKGTWVG